MSWFGSSVDKNEQEALKRRRTKLEDELYDLENDYKFQKYVVEEAKEDLKEDEKTLRMELEELASAKTDGEKRSANSQIRMTKQSMERLKQKQRDAERECSKLKSKIDTLKSELNRL